MLIFTCLPLLGSCDSESESTSESGRSEPVPTALVPVVDRLERLNPELRFERRNRNSCVLYSNEWVLMDLPIDGVTSSEVLEIFSEVRWERNSSASGVGVQVLNSPDDRLQVSISGPTKSPVVIAYEPDDLPCG